MLVDYCTLPCQDRVSGHSDLRTDVAICVISEQSLMPSFISILSHWTDGVSDRIILHGYDSAFYIVLWLLLLLY